MRKRDMELVRALAEGLLEDETEARRVMARSPRLRAAYHEQLAAIEALRSLEPVGMTAAERSQVRREVWSHLTSPAPERAGASLGWPARIGYAAAALVLVVGVGAALMGLLGGGDMGASVMNALGGEDGAPADSRELAEDRAGQPGDTNIEALRRYAQMARSDTLTFARATESQTTDAAKCANDEVAGQSYLGAVEVDGRRFAVFAAEGVEPRPITFLDPGTCEVVYIDR